MLLDSLYLRSMPARFQAMGRRRREREGEKKTLHICWDTGHRSKKYIYILFGEQVFEMHECILSHRLLFGSEITYAEISAEIKRFLNLKSNMMDINERASVQPYGKEGKVFSSPNCYLSENTGFLTASSPSVASKTPAFPHRTRSKHCREPNAISNLRTQSPRKEDSGCWSGSLRMIPLHLKGSNHCKGLSFLL